MGIAIAIMETIIIDEADRSYMLYIARTKSGKRVMVAAYITYGIPFIDKTVFTNERIFSSRQPKIWKELRSMI